MMSNTSYNELFNLDFKMFKKLVYEQDIDIDEDEVLYNYISEKTSITTCLKIKSFLSNCPHYFNLGLKV